jgi:hypothetical protein
MRDFAERAPVILEKDWERMVPFYDFPKQFLDEEHVVSDPVLFA